MKIRTIERVSLKNIWSKHEYDIWIAVSFNLPMSSSSKPDVYAEVARMEKPPLSNENLVITRLLRHYCMEKPE